MEALIAKGLVVEVGTGDASARGGKKPTMVELNADYARIFCVDVGSEVTRFASADLTGKIVARTESPTHPEQGARALLKTVKRGISRLVAEQTGRHAQATVVSVALPGIVDVGRGVVLETDNVFDWRDVRLASELKAAFDFPVHVDNDVNMAALGELNAQPPGGMRTFVLLRLSTGLGAGVVINGALYHGAHFAAGEIGHMVLDTRVGAISPGPRGYLESVVGVDRVWERMRALTRRRAGPLAPVDGEDHTWWNALDALVRGGNRKAQALSEDIVLHLGCAVANVAAMYDPEAVILLGEAFPPLLDRIVEIARKLVPWPVDVRLSVLGDEAPMRGALAAGLAHAYGQIAHTLQMDGQKANFAHRVARA
jgi:glucokinase